jgi:hypothetical protein
MTNIATKRIKKTARTSKKKIIKITCLKIISINGKTKYNNTNIGKKCKELNEKKLTQAQFNQRL